jgi:hypothetical protein
LPIAAEANLLLAVALRLLATSPSPIGGTAEPDDVTAVPVSAESGPNVESRPRALLGPLDRGEQAVSHRQQQRHQALVDPDLLAELPDRDRVLVAVGVGPLAA